MKVLMLWRPHLLTVLTVGVKRRLDAATSIKSMRATDLIAALDCPHIQVFLQYLFGIRLPSVPDSNAVHYLIQTKSKGAWFFFQLASSGHTTAKYSVVYT